MNNKTIYRRKIVSEASKIISLAIELTTFYGIQVFTSFSAHVNVLDVHYHKNNDWASQDTKVIVFSDYLSFEYWDTEQYKTAYNKVLNARRQLEQLKKR